MLVRGVFRQCAYHEMVRDLGMLSTSSVENPKQYHYKICLVGYMHWNALHSMILRACFILQWCCVLKSRDRPHHNDGNRTLGISSVKVLWWIALARTSLVRFLEFEEVQRVLTVLLVPTKVTRLTGRPEAVSASQNLEILNPLYDLTPSAFITAVVTEVGLILLSSISSQKM